MSRGPYTGEDDIVLWVLRDIVERVHELNGPLSGAQVADLSRAVIRVEQLARVRWGGKRPYIAKRPRQIERSDAIGKRDGSR